MRVIILTTGSVRRRYFVKTLASSFPVLRVFVETGDLPAPFETFHPFERQSREHETRLWFAGRPPKLGEIAETEAFPSLSEPKAVKAMAAARPDIMVVWGTRKLSDEVLDVCPHGAFNVHTGDPEQYRGLDAHLWAIYHRHFNALKVTSQRLARKLDTGDVVDSERIVVTPGMRLYELRGSSTEAAAELMRRAVVKLLSGKTPATRPLRSVGRYYSFMPSVMKELCVKRFDAYTAKL